MVVFDVNIPNIMINIRFFLSIISLLILFPIFVFAQKEDTVSYTDGEQIYINNEFSSEKEYFKTYLLSEKQILSKIFSLDLSKKEDRIKYEKITTNDSEYKLKRRFVDINNDGHKDLIIENYSLRWIGSGGHSTYLFIYEFGRYRFLKEFFGANLEVKDKSYKGYKDLIHTYKHYVDLGAFVGLQDYFRWNGKKYVNLSRN